MNCDKNKELPYLQHWDVNNLYGLLVLEKFQVNNTSQFNEDFIKNYNEDSDEGYSLEFGIQYLEKLHEFYHFYLKGGRLRKLIASI